MPAPVVAGLATEAHAALGALSEPDSDASGWPTLKLLDALLAPLQPVEDLIRETDTGPGYAKALDPDLAPPYLLRWLGQLAGVRVTVGNMTDPAWQALAREEIRRAAGFKRGTKAALVDAVQRHLTGSKVVRVLERDGSPYRVTVITRTSETPNTALAEAAARSQKPAGLVLTFVVSNSPVINEGTRTVDLLAGAIDDASVVNWT